MAILSLAVAIYMQTVLQWHVTYPTVQYYWGRGRERGKGCLEEMTFCSSIYICTVGHLEVYMLCCIYVVNAVHCVMYKHSMFGVPISLHAVSVNILAYSFTVLVFQLYKLPYTFGL